MSIIKPDKTYLITPHGTWEINDASKLSEYKRCRRKFFYRYVLGWTGEESNIHLVHGEGWHRAMSHVLRFGYEPEEIQKAFVKYLEHYREHFNEMQDAVNHPRIPALFSTHWLSVRLSMEMRILNFCIPKSQELSQLTITEYSTLDSTQSAKTKKDTSALNTKPPVR